MSKYWDMIIIRLKLLLFWLFLFLYNNYSIKNYFNIIISLLDHFIWSSGGTNLSAGQQQVLALARAALSDADGKRSKERKREREKERDC